MSDTIYVYSYKEVLLRKHMYFVFLFAMQQKSVYPDIYIVFFLIFTLPNLVGAQSKQKSGEWEPLNAAVM